MAEETSRANTIAKILFIVGGIILFLLLAVFILRLVPVAVSNIANIGSSVTSSIKKTINGTEEITVTTDSENVSNGTPVKVSFSYAPEVTGQYYVSYACADGLFFDIQSNNGPKRIICNTPLKLGSNIDAISLTPVITKQNTFFDATITVEYKDADANPVAKGTKTITVKNESGTAQTSGEGDNPYAVNDSLSGSTVTTSAPTSKPTTSTNTTTTSKPTSVGTTYVPRHKDLVVTRISKIGDSAFSFDVYNTGNSATGVWEFSYTDAENPSKTITSPVQASLGAGQGLGITVRFDGQKNSSQNISVFVDPYNKIAESNESNNTASVTITGSSSGNGGNGNGSYDEDDDADLVVTSFEVGRLSGNRFVEDDEIDEDDTAAVRFVVKNQGGESTGSWRFELTNLPYDNNDTYRSKSYSSLKPGQSIEIVADFDGIDTGRYNIRVEVDSDDDVDEERENNNTASETLEVNN